MIIMNQFGKIVDCYAYIINTNRLAKGVQIIVKVAAKNGGSC